MNVKEHIETLIKETKDVDQIQRLAEAYSMICNAETQERMTDYTTEIGDPFPTDTLN